MSLDCKVQTRKQWLERELCAPVHPTYFDCVAYHFIISDEFINIIYIYKIFICLFV